MIRNKRGKIVRFMPNPSQLHYLARKTRRNLILKPRQKGMSKWIDADQLIDCMRRATQAVVISHEKEATKRLFAAVKFFVEHMKVKPTISIDSKSEIRFPKRGSNYFIGTAGQRAFGRGDTINRAHLSEAAFYDDLERILGGVQEAAEYGQIDIETTANGREAFYDMWQRAKGGKSSYTPIFIPWYVDGEYSSVNLDEDERAGLSRSVQEMFSIPDAEFELEPEEAEARTRIQAETGILLNIPQMKWRRYKIWDKGRLFFQEYPEDDVSCFLQTGGSVFSKVIVDVRRRVDLGDFEAWAKREKWTEEQVDAFKDRRLYAGMDCAEGTLEGDAHSFAVIDIQDGQAVVIYEMTSNEPIDVFDLKVARICKEFNVQLGVEKNSVGVAHCKKLRELKCRFIEWETGPHNRPTMITDLEEAYRKAYLIETYKQAEDELMSMVYTEKRTNQANYRADAPKKKHDDRVFARAIAWQIRKKPVPKVSWV